ncbi:hypothetical protein A2791_03310 [Candidatus Saccharibacteria bacterium RIFCSPHIGHO2_01_FULL_46_30]|nr:MAG: hypothetical protein A2791_03310 [Candidatus Saccharibacteria bacterium RIFCSPHIGHO2_01_FULL_46_30]
MNTQTTGQQDDDQELAKVLAGVNQQLSGAQPGTDLSFEETGAATAAAPATAPLTPPSLPVPDLAAPAAPAPSEPAPHASSLHTDSSLEGIKKDALNELRPLVDKLNVSAEEKFDTYLLLLRSTDDTTLIGPAHDAAKSITDEARRAQALLDIIKEIDYLSAEKTAA